MKQPGHALDWNIDARWAWLGLALVVVAVGAIYARALGYDLLLYWDDNLYISDNSHIRSLDPASLKLLFTSFYVANYQPLTMLTYALEYQLAGGQASVYHATSILIHVANTLAGVRPDTEALVREQRGGAVRRRVLRRTSHARRVRGLGRRTKGRAVRLLLPALVDPCTTFISSPGNPDTSF